MKTKFSLSVREFRKVVGYKINMLTLITLTIQRVRLLSVQKDLTYNTDLNVVIPRKKLKNFTRSK